MMYQQQKLARQGRPQRCILTIFCLSMEFPGERTHLHFFISENKRDFGQVQQNHFYSFKRQVDFQSLSPPCPFEFWNLNGCQSVNFGANDFSFWLRVKEILLSLSGFGKLSSQTKSFFIINLNAILTLQLRPHTGQMFDKFTK